MLITEVQSNPRVMNDDSEWVELQNLGATTVSIAGWSLADYVGTDPAGESSTRWAFPPGAVLAPGQVIVVARYASGPGFLDEFGTLPSYELASATRDHPSVPNMIPSGGTQQWALNNADLGDAMTLRDGLGFLVDGVEWGTLDRTVPGLPAANPREGESLIRVNTSGSSNLDFAVTPTPTPFVGFTGTMGTPPQLRMSERNPAHAVYGASFALATDATHPVVVPTVRARFALAQSPTGPAETNFAPRAMNAIGPDRYAVDARLDQPAPGLNYAEPRSFNERYLRYYLEASDGSGATSTFPSGAGESSGNTSFFWENVLPRTALTPLATARAQGPDEVPLWLHHSVRVEGIAITSRSAFRAEGTGFHLVEAGGRHAIQIFDFQQVPADVQPGDVVRVTGKIGAFRGLRQIGPDQRSGQPRTPDPEIVVQVIGRAEVPVAVASIAGILAQAEELESQLVEIRGVTLLGDPGSPGAPPPTTWPRDRNVSATDGTGTLEVRIAGTTDLPNREVPAGSFTLRGVLTQFSESGLGGYQLMPRSLADVRSDGPMPPPVDGGVRIDAGSWDAGAQPGVDGGGGQPADGGVNEAPDAAARGPDAGVRIIGQERRGSSGCRCAPSALSAPWALLLVGTILFARRRYAGGRR